MISGQESTWELGRADGGLTRQSKGRLPVPVQTASVQGRLRQPLASALGLVHTWIAHLGKTLLAHYKRDLQNALLLQQATNVH